ncbi:MAG: hypothetical protein M1833_007177 [Piccolia ochrophora]|nr:MAG: hypothetical protein M1833_007177 [Piccolia ochrophora]
MATATEPARKLAEPPKEVESLFANVHFTIIETKDLTKNIAQGLITLLSENGGQYHPVAAETNRALLEDLTHIISSTSDFPQYNAATDVLISVVKPEWVTSSLSRKRLAQPRQFSPDPRLFFSGVTVSCADLPTGDKDAIIGGVLAMGGQYSGYLTKMVTHIVALTTDSAKCQQALAKNLRCKIVLPHWFDDCLKLGKRIDERPYTLPDPELTRSRPEDPVSVPSDSHLVGASSPLAGRLPTPMDTPSPLREDLSVFRKQQVLLAGDLDIGLRLRGTIEDLIVKGGGSVTGSVYKADILVCQYRESKEYRVASRADKHVGNLSWLYYLITHNSWTSPFRRLLHYPVARNGLPGFQDFRISVSNYGGEARLYLENLVWAAGGEFTKSMKQDNTHLITARPHSEKCTAAKEWNIHMVNHLWLEESYAKWEIQSISNARYTHFPARTNLGEVVGQTEINRQAVEQQFFPEDENSEDDLHEGVSGIELKDQRGKQQTKSSPVPISGATPKPSKVQKAKPDGKAPKTPSTSRLMIDGKENRTPSTTGSRGAKDRATAKLHNLAPDIALYEKEKKRMGGGIWGGRKGIDETNIVRKRSASRSGEEDSSVEPDEARSAKRKRTRPPVTMRLILTSYARWIGQLNREGEEKRRLRDLGILIIQDPTSCTHLVAPSIVRTQKFVCTLSSAPIVLSTSFIDHCLEQNALPARIEKFILRDPESERRYGFKLATALKHAKANKRRLLRGVSVYCTPGVHGGFDTYKAIVEANGGMAFLFRARAGSVSRRRVVGDDNKEEDPEEDSDEEGEEDAADVVYLLSGDSDEEKRLWERFKAMVRENDMVPKVVKTEWLLDVAMAQEMRAADAYALDAESGE